MVTLVLAGPTFFSKCGLENIVAIFFIVCFILVRAVEKC